MLPGEGTREARRATRSQGARGDKGATESQGARGHEGALTREDLFSNHVVDLFSEVRLVPIYPIAWKGCSPKFAPAGARCPRAGASARGTPRRRPQTPPPPRARA